MVWIEHEGLHPFLTDDMPVMHIDRFDLYIQGVFHYQDANLFREFIREFADIEQQAHGQGRLFTTSGMYSNIPKFQLPKKRYLFSASDIGYSRLREQSCIIKFPLHCNNTRFIANHPNGIAGGLSLDGIMRSPSALKNSDVPPRQRVERWFQHKSAKNACLDGDDNILRGVRYQQCDNIAERFTEYVSYTLALIRSRIDNAIEQTGGEVRFEWDTASMLFKHFEVYHDYVHPNALALVRSLHRDIECLSQQVDTSKYRTKKNVDGFSIILPLRNETNIKCVFYAKTYRRIRVELRYTGNLYQLIHDLPHPSNGMGAFIEAIVADATERLERIYVPLRRLLATKRVKRAVDLPERYTEFFYALNQAARRKESTMRELLTLLLENGSISIVPRNRYAISALMGANIVQKVAIKPDNKKQVCQLTPRYRPVIEALRTADQHSHQGIGNLLRRYAP